MSLSEFPTVRLRRLRYHPAVRRLVRETQLSPADLVLPLFVRAGEGERREIASMPGHAQLSPDLIAAEAEVAARLGLGGVILFGIPGRKDSFGSDSYADDGIVQQGIRAVNSAAPDLLCITDVCFCEYTDHGHCGILDGCHVDNDATLDLLARTAVSHARAGADVVAPSDMMDGRVVVIRQALDRAGFPELPIVSYAAKYASAFYGPFREAAASMPAFGDRRSHQMDPANAREAMTEIAIDLEEGADMVIVKPALPYLDIVRMARDRFDVPIIAYNVSGEYAMVKAAAQLGWIDERRVTLESLTAIKRAGAGRIITYHAKDAARWLREGTATERRSISVLDEWGA